MSNYRLSRRIRINNEKVYNLRIKQIKQTKFTTTVLLEYKNKPKSKSKLLIWIEFPNSLHNFLTRLRDSECLITGQRLETVRKLFPYLVLFGTPLINDKHLFECVSQPLTQYVKSVNTNNSELNWLPFYVFFGMLNNDKKRYYFNQLKKLKI